MAFLFSWCRTGNREDDARSSVDGVFDTGTGASSATKRTQSAREGSVTTPGGSRRFGSFAGRFVLQPSNPNGGKQMMDNYDILTPDQLRMGASKMRYELDNLYKAVAIMNQLALELDINMAVDNVRAILLELLNCERVTLFLVDLQQKELRARVANSEEHWKMIRVPFGRGVAGRVAETGTSMNIPDAYNCDLFNPGIDRKTGFRTRNILCVPISDMSGNHVAVIQALNKKASPGQRTNLQFTSLDEANLELFGVHLGNTLSKSRFHTAALAEKQRLAKLYEAFRKINAGGTTLDQLVSVLLKAVKNLVFANQALMLFVDHARDQLWSKWSVGTIMDGKDACLLVKLNQGMIGQAGATGEAFCQQQVPAATLAPQFVSGLGLEMVKSVLVQPIRDVRTGKVLAVVVAIDRSDEVLDNGFFVEPNFTGSDQDAMAVLAMEAATVLSERSLEVSFASALSTVSSSGTAVSTGVLEDALQAQLMSYAGISEIESIASSCRSMSMNDRGSDASIHDQHVSESPSMSPTRQPSLGPEGGRTAVPILPSSEGSFALRHGLKLAARSQAGRMSLSDSMREEILAAESAQGVLHGRTKQQREALLSWDLDITLATRESLVKMVYDIFNDSGVLEHFKIEDRKLMAFIAAVCSHYHENPYHNFCHVVYVLHCAYMIMSCSEAASCLTRTDQLVLLIAALCHDIDHDGTQNIKMHNSLPPGHTNNFHIQTQTPLAQRYNDISVMENHHCAITFAILAKRDCAILEHLERPRRQELRKLIISAILATDMSYHFSLTTEFKNHGAFSIEKEEDRLLLIKAIIHAADISNPVRPFHVNCVLSSGVHREFRAQVAEELRLGLTPMPHMNAKDEHVQCSLEMNFIDCVVSPLWEHMTHIFPKLAACNLNVRKNRAAYQALAECSNEEIAAALQAAEAGDKDPLGRTSSKMQMHDLVEIAVQQAAAAAGAQMRSTASFKQREAAAAQQQPDAAQKQGQLPNLHPAKQAAQPVSPVSDAGGDGASASVFAHGAVAGRRGSWDVARGAAMGLATKRELGHVKFEDGPEPLVRLGSGDLSRLGKHPASAADLNAVKLQLKATSAS